MISVRAVAATYAVIPVTGIPSIVAMRREEIKRQITSPGNLVTISPAARRLAEIDFAKEAGSSVGRVSPVAQAVAQTEKTKPDITVPFTEAVANVAERAAQKSVLDAYKETTPKMRRPHYE